MATLGNVGFSGYQILSSDMGSLENVNLQGITFFATGGWDVIKYPIEMNWSLPIVSVRTREDSKVVATQPACLQRYDGTFAEVGIKDGNGWRATMIVLGGM